MSASSAYCHACSKRLTLRATGQYYPDGRPRAALYCPNYPACDTVVWAHPDGRPLGVPSDRQTRRARYLAHEALATLLWSRNWTADQGYALLSYLTGKSAAEAHIGLFDRPTCEALVEVLESLYPKPKGAT